MELGIRARKVIEAPAAIAAATGGGSTTELIRLSPASLDLLRAHGAVPGEGGFFRMFVQDRSGKIAGQLQWEQVNLGIEGALSMQTAAVTLALRGAIAEVQESVQRIENKLDRLTNLLRAQRMGDALGDYRTLDNLASRVRASGRVANADWTTVAAMGPAIGRALEGLRAHIVTLLERDDPTNTPWGRAGEVTHILEDEWLEESLALLAIAEQNFNFWQEIRIAHVRSSERHQLADTIADAGRQLDEQREADQIVLDALIDFATVVADPRLLDGLDPLHARRLRLARDQLDAVVKWFADQRLLDATPLATEPFPGFLQSARHLVGTTQSVAKGLGTKVGQLVVRITPRAGRKALPPPPPDQT